MRANHKTQANPDIEGLWTADDVAAFFQASRSWAYHAARSGMLPAVHIGGLLRFDPNLIRTLAKSAK